MKSTRSANETENQPVATNVQEGSEDIPGAVHTGEAQPESKQASLTVPIIESMRGTSEGNIEDEEFDCDEKNGMLRNNVARHMWSVCMRLMTEKKRDENEETISGGEELKTTILCLATIYAWFMTAMECLG